MSIIVNYTPFVDWKNVQRTLAIQNEMLSFAAEPRGVERQLMTIGVSINVNYAPFVDWKNVQRTLAIQNEMLSYAAEPRGNLLFDYLRCTIYVQFGQFSRLSPY